MWLYLYHMGYLNELGAAAHMALGSTPAQAEALNHGFGVVFARCVFDSTSLDGTSRGLMMPWIYRTEKGFGMVALRCAFGENDLADPSRVDALCRFTSPDLVTWTEEKPLLLSIFAGAADVRISVRSGGLRLWVLQNGWHAWDTDAAFAAMIPVEDHAPPERVHLPLWDAAPACALEVTDEEAARLRLRLTAPRVPAEWPRYPFPLMTPRGDPMAIRLQGDYLYMATDDEHGQRALKLRRVHDLAELPSAEDHVLLEANEEGDYSGCLWAPELHQVGQRLCIFFAAGMPHWYTVQSRMMWLEGDDPTRAECWSAPRRMVRADGTPLYEEGITLDMTVLNTAGGLYVVWSQRQILLEPVRCGTADLMIARLDAERPWRLASEPVVLSRPEWGWERMHSAVNEGPFLLRHNGRLFLTYAAALIDHTYSVGLLTARDGDDLLQPESWVKCGYPVFHRLSHHQMIGAGHNAFVRDSAGRDWMLIHSLHKSNYLRDPHDGRRYPCILPVVWDDDDFPHFDAQDD